MTGTPASRRNRSGDPSADGPVVPVAASSSVAATLSTSDRPACVLGAFRTALYVLPEGADDVLAVVTNDALRLPCAVVLPTSAAEGGLDTSAGPVRVGGGRVQLGAVVLRPARWWQPARARGPRGRLHVPAEAAEACEAHLPRDFATAVDELVGALAAAQAGNVRAAADVRAAHVRAAADRLIGRGPGLTPSGDDVLAGLLVAAPLAPYAAGALGVLGAHVSEHADGRTTALSATLLRCAAGGYGVAELVGFVDAVAGWGQPVPAYERLARIGHTSGRDLAVGVLAAARVGQRRELAA